MNSLRFKLPTRIGHKGVGLVETLMVAAMIAGGAVVGTKMMVDMKARQRHSAMVDVQKRLAYYHNDLIQANAVRSFTVAANADIVAHANGTTPVADGERRCMQMRGQGNAILLADTAVAYNAVTAPCVAGGKYFDEKGKETCQGVACTAANARFHVHGLWEADAGTAYKIGIVVRQINKPADAVRLKDINSLDGSLSGAIASQIWSLDVGTQSIMQVPANPTYFGMGVDLGSVAPEANLHVVGDFYVSSNASGNAGNKLKVSTTAGKVGVSTTLPLEYIFNTNSNLHTGTRTAMSPVAGDAYIGVKGTAADVDRVGIGFAATSGTGYVSGVHFRVGNQSSPANSVADLQSDYLRIYAGRVLDIHYGNGTLNRFGRIQHTGFNDGNMHIDCIFGETYINWFGGATQTHFGAGNNADHGPLVATTYTVSDERLKKNIHPIQASLEIIDQLRGVSYRRKSDGQENIGFIAQEVEPILPMLVSEANLPDGEKFKALNYSGFTAVIAEGIKAFLKQLRTQETEIIAAQAASENLQMRLEKAVQEQKEIRSAWCQHEPSEAHCR